MSAVPEDFMPDPEEPQTPPPPEDEEDESFWQWVALVVLLACWLAEAYL